MDLSFSLHASNVLTQSASSNCATSYAKKKKSPLLTDSFQILQQAKNSCERLWVQINTFWATVQVFLDSFLNHAEKIEYECLEEHPEPR